MPLSRKNKKHKKGSWLLAEELLDAGDPAFIDELCRIEDADRLGTFAATWFGDRRPASRRFLIAYLQLPFANYRHEALIKRLFKLAEQAADDELMAYFTVGFDRSIRREQAKRHQYDWNTNQSWVEEYIRTPSGTEIARHHNPYRYLDSETGEYLLASSRDKHDRMRLFSLKTRQYLRRRCWRYFRLVGKSDPSRYVASMGKVLALYQDADVNDGLALLDNWTLMHALFHDCDAVFAASVGWRLNEGKSLAELKPAPMYASAWLQESTPLVTLLCEAQCRPVRQWAMEQLRAHFPTAVQSIPTPTLIQWIASDDPELAALATETLAASNTDQLQVADWLQLIRAANSEVLDTVCDLVRQRLTAEALSLDEVVQLACARPIPIAELGMAWLGKKELRSPEDCQTMFQVTEAECDKLRGPLVAEVVRIIRASTLDSPDWVLELLDCRHAEVRRVGWEWLLADEQLAHHIEIWQKLAENPYDDVQLQLTELLEPYAAKHANDQRILQFGRLKGQLDPELVRTLWASVILNIHRGGRQKPRVVAAIVDRMLARPEEVTQLLPLLAVALRSVRSVEFRAGLTGIVELVEQCPEHADAVGHHFPELSLQ